MRFRNKPSDNHDDMKKHVIRVVVYYALSAIILLKGFGYWENDGLKEPEWGSIVIGTTLAIIATIMMVIMVVLKKRDKTAQKNKKSDPNQPHHDAIADSMQRAIANAKKKDPLVQVKLAAKGYVHNLTEAMKKSDPKGVHIESLLTILASLGGFSCQMSIRDGLVKTGRISEDKAFVVVGCKNGKKYYMGDLLNEYVATSRLSIFTLVGGAWEQTGGKHKPDINNIFKHVANTVCSEEFGKPRVPDNHRAGDLPINYVKTFWPKVLPILQEECDSPIHWPLFFGLALQQAMIMGKDVLNPDIAFSIVMETAIPMSKIDPQEIAVV